MRFLTTTRYLAPRFLGLRCMTTSKGPAGDGRAGAIRDAGGAFSKLEVAHEEEYFYKKQREQLKKLKADQITQIEFHQKQIEEHEEALKRHKETLAKLKSK